MARDFGTRWLTTVWLRTPIVPVDTLSRFIIDFALIAENVFIEFVHKFAEQVLLGKLFRIDGTVISLGQRDALAVE